MNLASYDVHSPPWRWRGLAVAPSHAAPVTLRYTAAVSQLTDIDGFLPPTWSDSLQDGDIVSGTFTFEPVDVPTAVQRTVAPQAYDFTLQIKSRTLLYTSYRIDVFNDSRSSGNGPVQFRDSIYVGSNATIPDEAGGLPLDWLGQLLLIGDSSVLDGADLPADPEVWRRFSTFRSLTVILIDPSVDGVYGFRGVIQTFDRIPEPSALDLSLGTLCLVARSMFCRQAESLVVVRHPA